MSAAPVLAEVMAAPSPVAAVVGPAPLDLISSRTSRREGCPRSFAVAGILGTWGVLVNAPCGRWSCRVCGERQAHRYASIARAGCGLSTERIRLLTPTCPRESPATSWAELPGRWDKLRKRLARYLGRPLTYFGTVELQKRGNPHLHFLLRDSGFIPKAVVHQACTAAGFGFSDIRQIQPGAGVHYVTKYLHKSAGQVLPSGARRIRRSRDWYTEPPAIVASWGPDWRWQSVEHLGDDLAEAQLRAAGVLRVFRYEQRVGSIEGD